MNWKNYWNDHAANITDNIAQVQRKDLKSTYLTVNHIIRTLKIESEDKVLDVCCGNGLITQQIAKKCKSIIGIDQSEELIAVGKHSFTEMNCVFVLGSAFDIAEVLPEQLFDKIYLQFSLQYFDKKGDGERIIKTLLDCLSPDGKIFFGDITNADKHHVFYNSLRKKIHYFKSRITGTNDMGKFWKSSELDEICAKLGVSGTHIMQPKELPYSHYRFDYLIEP